MEWTGVRQAEDVIVNVANDCDGCVRVFCEDLVNDCLEVVGEGWVPVRSAVDVDDGVNWIGPLFCAVELYDYRRCLWDDDVIEEGGEEVGVVVNGDVSVVFLFVAFEFIAVGVDGVFLEVVVRECDYVWAVGEEFYVF